MKSSLKNTDFNFFLTNVDSTKNSNILAVPKDEARGNIPMYISKAGDLLSPATFEGAAYSIHQHSLPSTEYSGSIPEIPLWRYLWSVPHDEDYYSYDDDGGDIYDCNSYINHYFCRQTKNNKLEVVCYREKAWTNNLETRNGGWNFKQPQCGNSPAHMLDLDSRDIAVTPPMAASFGGGYRTEEFYGSIAIGQTNRASNLTLEVALLDQPTACYSKENWNTKEIENREIEWSAVSVPRTNAEIRLRILKEILKN